jgi:tRNA nucleotidyltransferase (CCA-adding enzyme)
MLEQGFKPVGKDFPVFLHPETHEEYALARTERKTARGYHGFEFHAAPDVTLEQDLERRDLTINAMARDDDGNLVDPFNGAEDLSAGILRHVSPAFSEDPVRVLRVARFAARYGFDIAPETDALMREMVRNGEVDALVPERVWQELSRGLTEKRPSRMLEILHECGALERVAPELASLFAEPERGTEALAALDAAAAAGEPLEVRVAALAKSLDPFAIEKLAERLKLPANARDLALLAARHGNAIVDAEELPPEALLELLDATDAWRRPERFTQLLRAATAGERQTTKATRRLEAARAAAASLDAGAIAKASANADEIRTRLAAARLEAIKNTTTR